MKPRIKKVNGEWRVLGGLVRITDIDWLIHLQAYNFCIMLNNRK